MIWKCLAVFLASYAIGSVNLSILVSRVMFGGDIRSHGSGNAGATNMARVFGWGAGLATFGGDALKAVICMVAGCRLLGDPGLSLAGMGCILGHCYPVLYRFKGGKGVSVGAVIAYGIDWRVGAAATVGFLLGALVSKKVSLGSICAALTLTVAALAFGVSAPKLALAVFSMCLAIFQHRANIERLVRGTEPDFKAGKGKS